MWLTNHSRARLTGRAWLAGLCFSLFSLSSGALNGAEGLTLDDAIAATLSDSPNLKALGFAMRAQDARVLQASLSPRPELNVTVEDVLGTGIAQGVSGAQTTVSIAWVREGDLRQRRIDVATTGSLVLAAEADIMRLDAAAQTARYHIHALARQAQLALAEQAILLADESIAAVTRRITAGTTLTTELYLAQAERARRELRREDLSHELLGDYYLLASQWGDLVPAFATVDGDLNSLPVVAAFDDLLARMQQNPDLERFLSEQRLNEAELRLEQYQRNALWRFNAGLRRMELDSNMGFVAGVSIPLNRGNQNQGRIDEVRAKLEETAALHEAAGIRLQTSLFVLYQELQHSLHRVTTLRDDIIPRYQEALTETRRAYEIGRSSFLEWMQVQELLLAANGELVEAEAQALQYNIEIERLTGMRMPQAELSL